MAADLDPQQLGQRIAVIGPSNSGKSTFAYLLGLRRELPVIHLDLLAHIPGTHWQKVSQQEFIDRHDKVIVQDRWIIEGNYSHAMPQRLARAQTLLWFDPPLLGCIWRYMIRSLSGGDRPGKLEGALSEFSLALVKYTLLNYPRNKKIYRAIIAANPHLNYYRLTSFREIRRLNDGLAAKA